MLLHHLFEDAESDARRSALADQVFQRAVSFLYDMKKHNLKLPTAIIDGKNVPCLPAEDFDPPAMFHDLILIFQPNEYAMGGKAVKTKEKAGGRYQYYIIIGVDGDTVDDIIKSLRYDRVETVVRHELQHIIDYKRYKGDVFKSREPNFKGDDAGIKPSTMNNQEQKAYHNSSAELNAYFHNMAEPLLKRIRFMKAHGADMVGLFPPLPKDFRTYLSDNLSNKYGVIKRHWENLTPDNQKKAISRLAKLFDLYWQMAAKYSEEQSEVVTNV